MPIDIMSLLRQTRSERSGDLESLATKLVDGQQVPADQVLQTMTSLGVSDQDLQAECDRIERVRDLQKRAASAGDASKRLAKLDGELAKLTDAHSRTGQALAEWHQRHDEQHMTLRHTIESAERAEHDMMLQRNLPSKDRTALAEAQQAAADATSTAAAQQRQVSDLQSQLRTAESLLAQHQDGDKRLRDPETQRQIDHLSQAVASARSRLARAEAELAPLQKRAADAESVLRDLTESVRRRVVGK